MPPMPKAVHKRICWRWLAALAVIAAAAGCRAPGGLESTNPYERAHAAATRAEAGDESAVARLVALLQDEDPAVRLYAIRALYRLRGTTLGYKYYAPEGERAVAVRRWQEALQTGTLPEPTGTTPRGG